MKNMVNMEEDKNSNSENNKNVDNKRYKYLPLNPVNDKAYEPNAELLFDKIKDPNVKNIGIIGAYGSGKSSLIRTFNDKYNDNGEIKSLNISLASFNVDSCCDKQNDKQKDAPVKGDHKMECVNDNCAGVGDIDNAIEKSILQQMLYVESASKLPYSKINRVESIPIKKYVQLGIIAVCFLTLVVCLADIFANISNSSVGIFNYLFKQKTLSTIISFVAIIVLVSLLVKLIKIARIKFHQVEIDLNNAQGSLLNRFLDEVLYFFEKTKYNVIVFEDLDRFKNLNIFIKLRELNTILNSNKKIAKQGKITFVYAVKTDIFSEHTDRTKFFDFILNIYPTLSPENACAIINDGLEESRLGKTWLSDNYKYDISFFVMDRRVLNSVINDCIQYIQNCNEPTFYDTLNKHELMFSVMLYKNVCPNEYAELEKHEGELIKLLSNVEEVRSNKNKDLKEKLSGLQKALRSIDASFDLNDMRYLIKGVLTNYYGPYGGLNGYTGVDVNVIDDFSDVNQIIYYKSNRGEYYYTTINGINLKLKTGTLESRYRSKKKIEEYDKQCKDVDKEIKDIPQNNYEFIKKYPNEVFDKISVTPLLRAMIVNGYITENYVDYISMGNEASMSANDTAFCQMVISKSRPKFDAVIDVPYVVIEKLSYDKFAVPSILNIKLCNYLIENKWNADYDKKIENLKNVFKLNASEFEEFINCYFSDIKYYSKPFVGFLIDNEINFIVDLLGSPLSYDDKTKIIKDILLNANSEKLLVQESVNLICDLLQGDDSFNKNIDEFKSGFNVLKEIGYKIKDITEYNYDESVLRILEKNNLWELNESNLLYIVSKLYGISRENINYKGITVIKGLDVNIRDYILNDKTYYVHDIMLKSDMLDLDEADFLNILLEKDISIEDKLVIISKQQTPMRYTANLSVEIRTALISNNKVKANSQELSDLLSANMVNSELKSAIARYMYIHSKDFKDFRANVYINLAYCFVNYDASDNNEAMESYFDRLKGLSWDIKQITNEKSIIFMLNRDMIAINKNNVDEISGKYPNASKVLVEKNIEYLIPSNLINAKLAKIYIESENRDIKFVSKLCMIDNLDFVDDQPFAFRLADIIIDTKIQICDNLYDKIVSLDIIDPEKLKSRELFISQWGYIENNEHKIKIKLSKIDYDVYVELAKEEKTFGLDATIWKNDKIIGLLKSKNLIKITTNRKSSETINIKWLNKNIN